MLQRYQYLKQFITRANGFDNDVTNLVLHELQEHDLEQLLAVLKAVHQCSMALQKDNGVELRHVRKFFDVLIAKAPSFARYLGPESDIVHSPIFEKAVIKVQSGNERNLTRNERATLKRFERSPSDHYSEDDDSSDDEERKMNTDNPFLTIVEDENKTLLKKRRLEINSESAYLPMLHVEPTSNCCERLFSRAKIFSDDRRKRMCPYHLELSLVLWANRGLWDANTIDEFLNLQPEDEDPEDVDRDAAMAIDNQQDATEENIQTEEESV
jgi:hypothetical protein